MNDSPTNSPVPATCWCQAASNLAHGRRAQRAVALAQRLADLVDGVVLLAQLDDQIAGGGLLWLRARAGARGGEKDGVRLAAEVVAHDVEGADAVAEVAGDVFRGAAVDEISAEGFVDALFGGARLEEEAAALA